MSTPIVSISNLQKNYGGLRPLRLQYLEIATRERVALSGLDAVAAELFVNLLTGSTLPDQGSVATFGRDTAAISDPETWIASLDKFGIVTSRAVLLESSTLLQNLALPFTLSIEEIPAEVASQVAALARDCGIADTDLSRPAAELPAHTRMRIHLARAVALNPELLLIEHPTAEIAETEKLALARDIAAVAERRQIAALIMTMDVEFAELAAHRSLAVQPATGAVVPWKRKRGWFR